MSDSQNLGPVGIWQIKNFPDGLRRAIVERAAVEKVTVGELLTRIMVAVMEADWQVGGAVNPSATRPTENNSGNNLPTLERAIAAAVCLAGAPEVPVAFRRRANRLLRESLPSGAPREARQKLRLAVERPALLAEAVRSCRECGCTDADCSGCIARTGKPCTWVEADLCSACVDYVRALRA